MITSALHIYPTTFTHESRILKETGSLIKSGLFDHIYIGALWAEGLAEYEQLDTRRTVRRIRLRSMTFSGQLGKLLRFAEWYLRIFFEFRRKRPTFINCHSLSVLPLGVLFSWLCGSRLIYDTHELETETSESKGLRKVFAKFLERALIGQAEAVIVVCDSIGRWYRDTYKLIEVHVVRNIPHARPIADRKSKLLRQMFGVGDGESLFIVQGIMDIGRGIDIILEAFSRVDSDKHVVFFGNGSLQRKLIEWSTQYPNIHYHPAVSPQKLLEFTAGADVGISLLKNTCLNHYYCLPNKVFEYLLSGLPVIISDFPEMAKIVDENGCGWKSSVDTVSLIELLGSITPQEIAEKTIAAKERASTLGWHNEERILIDLYKRLLKRDDE